MTELPPVWKPPMAELSPREREVLEFIHRCQTEHGMTPNAREMGAAVGICGIHISDIRAMQKKGYIVHEHNVARSTRLTDYGRYMIGVDVCEIWDAEDVL